MTIEKPQAENKFEKQELKLREKFFKALTKNFTEVLKDADILEKEIFVGGEFLLVAGGIKPATDIEIPVEIIGQLASAGITHDNFFINLKSRVEKLGLKMSTPRVDEDFPKTVSAYIYNPGILMPRSQKLPALIPFGENDDIDLWVAENRDTGIDMDFIKGSLFGFPPSSIESFIAYKQHTQGLHKLKKFGEGESREFAEHELKAIREKEEKSRHFIRSYDEVYMAQNPEAPDIVEYERVKKEFFDGLSNNEEFYRLWQDVKKAVNS